MFMRGRGENEGLTYPTELALSMRQTMSAPYLTSHTGSPGPRVWDLRGVVVSCEGTSDAPHFKENLQYSMGHARSRERMRNACFQLKLMPEKLLLIRKYLNVSQPVMAKLLELSRAGFVSEYEKGVREPNLIVTFRYSRLGKVSMESVVDDEVNVTEFREQLGSFELVIT